MPGSGHGKQRLHGTPTLCLQCPRLLPTSQTGTSGRGLAEVECPASPSQTSGRGGAPLDRPRGGRGGGHSKSAREGWALAIGLPLTPARILARGPPPEEAPRAFVLRLTS